jgi:hypothetical protein
MPVVLSENMQFRDNDDFDAYNKSKAVGLRCIQVSGKLLRSAFLHDDLSLNSISDSFN